MRRRIISCLILLVFLMVICCIGYLNKQDISAMSGGVEQHEDVKRIALTFDDGPHPRYTPEILGILEEYGVKATFNLNSGIQSDVSPFIIKEIVVHRMNIAGMKELYTGHEIASHALTQSGPTRCRYCL